MSCILLIVLFCLIQAIGEYLYDDKLDTRQYKYCLVVLFVLSGVHFYDNF